MSAAVNQSPGNCQCSGCTVNFTFTGCGGLALKSAPITIRASSGGSILATGTADSSGQLTLTWAGAGGSIWIDGPDGRFNGQSVSVTCGGSVTVAFTSIASGYVCTSGCAWPISQTLHFSITGISIPMTLTWSLGQWQGSISYSYPGCSGCSPVTLTVQVTWGLPQISWFRDASPGCPNPGGGTFVVYQPNSTTKTCYEPGVTPFSFLLNYNAVSAGSPIALFFCSTAAQTGTITE